MRNFLQLAASIWLMLIQAVQQIPFAAAASLQIHSADEDKTQIVRLDTSNPQAIESNVAKPNFDTDVLAPLRVAQAKAAAEAAAKRAAAKRVATKTASVVRTVAHMAPATAENMLRLRLCEAGNIYTRNSGNGYYGAYQFNISTWGNWGGYVRPDLAPAAVQDAKFLETYNRRGWSPWPTCSRKLGLIY